MPCGLPTNAGLINLTERDSRTKKGRALSRPSPSSSVWRYFEVDLVVVFFAAVVFGFAVVFLAAAGFAVVLDLGAALVVVTFAAGLVVVFFGAGFVAAFGFEAGGKGPAGALLDLSRAAPGVGEIFPE